MFINTEKESKSGENTNMPTGPLGFPRLTSIGPLVEEEDDTGRPARSVGDIRRRGRSGIQPAIDVEPGVYEFSALKNSEPITAGDTREVINMESDFSPEFRDVIDIDSTRWKYHKVQIVDILENNSFSRSLLEMMSSFEQNIGEQALIMPDDEIVNQSIEDVIFAHASGDDTFLNDDLLINTAASYQQFLQFESTSDLKQVVEKVSGDIDRVMNIADDIRSSGEYFPPTVEQDLSEESGLFFGTIDGSHRVVALSQLLGTEREIFVWEWINEDEFTV